MSADASKPRLSSTGDKKQYEPTYYGDSKPQVTAANDVALQSEVRSDAASGVKEPEKVGAVGGNSYPGRPLPKAEKVEDAKPREGLAKQCADKELTEQRQDLK